MGTALKPAELAAAAAIVQPHLCSDAGSAPAWTLYMMMAVIRDMAKAGVDPARTGLRFEVGTVKDKRFSPQDRTHLRMATLGHPAAPVAGATFWEGSASAWSATTNPLLVATVERHLDVERILRDGGDPLAARPETTLCDPVVAAALSREAQHLLDMLPMDRPFTTRREWSRRGIRPVPIEAALGISGTLTPGRLRVRRIEVAPGAHYDPPAKHGDNGVLTVRRTHWPDQLRRALPGRPLSEILGLTGIPAAHVVRSIRTQNAHTVVTVGGDHGFAPMR